MESLRRLARELAGEELCPYLERSRRGGHLWLFLDEPKPGDEVRSFARGLQSAHNVEGVEVFPKQGKLGKGPGSLVRMPFGVHRLTGRVYDFCDWEGNPLAPTPLGQLLTLAAPRTVPSGAFEHYAGLAPPRRPKPLYAASDERLQSLASKVKASISVLEFVGRYVELSPSGSGFVGRCPFHDDARPSFGVNADENHWHCFAGCAPASSQSASVPALVCSPRGPVHRFRR